MANSHHYIQDLDICSMYAFQTLTKKVSELNKLYKEMTKQSNSRHVKTFAKKRLRLFDSCFMEKDAEPIFHINPEAIYFGFKVAFKGRNKNGIR